MFTCIVSTTIIPSMQFLPGNRVNCVWVEETKRDGLVLFVHNIQTDKQTTYLSAFGTTTPIKAETILFSHYIQYLWFGRVSLVTSVASTRPVQLSPCFCCIDRAGTWTKRGGISVAYPSSIWELYNSFKTNLSSHTI
jgi:hypothetical protein